MRLFEFQDTIGKNIIYFIRLKGYTKSSLSRLSRVSKSDLDLLTTGEFSDPLLYQQTLEMLTSRLNLSYDYFLERPIEKPGKWQLNTQAKTERSLVAQELLDDLDELISVIPFYIK